MKMNNKRAFFRTTKKKDQDIENMMSLVKVTKDCLQDMRDDVWLCLFGGGFFILHETLY
jgi:hypothetical protein